MPAEAWEPVVNHIQRGFKIQYGFCEGMRFAGIPSTNWDGLVRYFNTSAVRSVIFVQRVECRIGMTPDCLSELRRGEGVIQITAEIGCQNAEYVVANIVFYATDQIVVPAGRWRIRNKLETCWKKEKRLGSGSRSAKPHLAPCLWMS